MRFFKGMELETKLMGTPEKGDFVVDGDMILESTSHAQGHLLSATPVWSLKNEWPASGR